MIFSPHSLCIGALIGGRCIVHWLTKTLFVIANMPDLKSFFATAKSLNHKSRYLWFGYYRAAQISLQKMTCKK